MNEKKSGGCGFGISGIIGIIIAIVIVITVIGSCSNSNSNGKYKDTLDSGMKKYYNGDPMTKEEHDAVKNFNDWKNNQGEKTYDKW